MVVLLLVMVGEELVVVLLGSVRPGFSELSLDMILVHSRVDWITQRNTLDYTTW